MPDSTFELLVNGVPRTYRDQKAMAVDAGRVLKGRDRGSEVIVVDMVTREWALVPDLVNEVVWQPPAQAPDAKPIG